MKKLTLYRKDKEIGSITLKDGQYSIEAITENLRLGLDNMIKEGLWCRRIVNLDDVIDRHMEPEMIRIEAYPDRPDFFEQAKLYFELSFDTTCTITEE